MDNESDQALDNMQLPDLGDLEDILGYQEELGVGAQIQLQEAAPVNPLEQELNIVQQQLVQAQAAAAQAAAQAAEEHTITAIKLFRALIRIDSRKSDQNIVKDEILEVVGKLKGLNFNEEELMDSDFELLLPALQYWMGNI